MHTFLSVCEKDFFSIYYLCVSLHYGLNNEEIFSKYLKFLYIFQGMFSFSIMYPLTMDYL